MDADRIFTGLENLLSILHIVILFLSALMFTFVFIINWEDWFFGINLAGPDAGLFLAAKAAGAVILMYLVTQCPDRWKTVLPASTAYFGFLFVNAMVTYQTTAPGSFPVLLALPVILPVLLLLLKLRSAGSKKTTITTHEGDRPPGTPPDTDKTRGMNPLLVLFLEIIVVMVFVILIVPPSISLIVSNVPFLHRMALPPAHDTILFKVNQSGDREWVTGVPGYSLDFVRMADGENESFFLYGTYFVPDRDDAQIRVLKIDRKDRCVWDMMRGMKYGILPDETAQIEFVDPAGPGATAWLTNGMSLRIDGEGNVTAQTPPARTIPQPTAEIRDPAGYTTGQLPAKSTMVRIRSGGEQGLLFPIEDTLNGREILSVYSVNPAADAGYLVSAAVQS
jgi:hypothetical protein